MVRVVSRRRARSTRDCHGSAAVRDDRAQTRFQRRQARSFLARPASENAGHGFDKIRGRRFGGLYRNPEMTRDQAVGPPDRGDDPYGPRRHSNSRPSKTDHAWHAIAGCRREIGCPAFARFFARVSLVMANDAAYCVLHPNSVRPSLALIAAFRLPVRNRAGISAVMARRALPKSSLQQRQFASISIRTKQRARDEHSPKTFDLAARRTASLMLKALVRNRKSKNAPD